MVKSIYDKICKILEQNKSEINENDYARLMIYIDLLFNFAECYEITTK